MTKRRITTCGLALAAVLAGAVLLWAAGSAQASPPPVPATQSGAPLLLNYQGQLLDPVTAFPVPDGVYNMTFSIYDAAVGPTLIWSESQAVQVTRGLYNVVLGNFTPLTVGDFNGINRWLELVIGGETLTPRVQIVSAPYAIQAEEAKNADTLDGHDSPYFQRRVNGTCTPGSSIRVVNEDGSVVCDLHDGTVFWALLGNAGTTYGTNFLGTTDAVSLTLAVSNTVGFRLAPTGNTPNVIGGSVSNEVAAGVHAATIGGGGEAGAANLATGNYATVGGGLGNSATISATVGGGILNEASGHAATVGGGNTNTASNEYATVGGGWLNTASGSRSTVGGGWLNTAIGDRATVAGGRHNVVEGTNSTVGGGMSNTASAANATVGGGEHNTASHTEVTIGGGEYNTASGENSTIAGGAYNTVTQIDGTICGGYQNVISGTSATIAGGQSNTAAGDNSAVGGGSGNQANKGGATVAGGASNVAGTPGTTNNYQAVGGGYQNTATGTRATVPGGQSNEATGNYSFAAGRRAKAIHSGAFVWADSHDTDCNSDAAYQFKICSTWGAEIEGGDLFVPDGYVVVGNPSGVNTSVGSINAKAVYDDGTLLNDYVFDWYFDGEVRQEDRDLHGNYRMKSLEEMVAFMEEKRHLPTIIGREEWNEQGEASLGTLVSDLWETVETQAIYIAELNEAMDERDAAIEAQGAQIAELTAAVEQLKGQSRSPWANFGPLGLLFGALLGGLVVVRHGTWKGGGL